MHRVKECDRLGVPIDGGFSVISRQTPTNPGHDAVCNLRTWSLLKFISFFLLTLSLLLACYEKCQLLKLSAACKCSRQGLISVYRQTVWTQIRLLLKEQSDLGPHCLLQRGFKSTSRRDSRRHLVWLAAKEFSKHQHDVNRQPYQPVD